MSSSMATIVVATGFLLVAWLRWLKERTVLSAQRRVLGSIGLFAASVATIGCGASVLYPSQVDAWLGSFWSLHDLDVLLFRMCLISFGFSCSCRGISRLMGAGSALLLAASLGAKIYYY